MSFDGAAFGRRVAAAREWAGLKPKQLADRLGVSAEAIYRLERGTRTTAPKRAELRLLAEILNQPEEWLRDGTDPPWSRRGAETVGEAATAALPEGLSELLGALEKSVEQLIGWAVEDGDRLARVEQLLDEEAESPPARQVEGRRS